ncbi:hypothetical protein PIB30_060022 [Stylosanthes scabra]|uniref:Uncharacterized protein n=1 Tax=Stylosanthes scabra TaxID=79078 RepID=A0ABU6ZJ39_9FABA|nr:hypothetical protein [Stylosanthes scabra]
MDSNIMFRNAFDAFGFKNSNLKTHQLGVMGLDDHFIKPNRSIDLLMTIGSGKTRKTVMADMKLSQGKSELSSVTGKQLRNTATETSPYGSNPDLSPMGTWRKFRSEIPWSVTRS